VSGTAALDALAVARDLVPVDLHRAFARELLKGGLETGGVERDGGSGVHG
jgi:hypothetical protein